MRPYPLKTPAISIASAGQGLLNYSNRQYLWSQGGPELHLLVLDGEGFLNGGPQRLHHLRVLKVVHDVLQDVLVRHKAQRTEEHKDGDVGADVRQVDHDGLPHTCGAPAPP